MKTLALLATTALLSLAACSGGGGNTDDQLGSNPKLPDINQYLVPPMHVASVEPWKNGAMPTVAAGLQINAFARDFHNVRSVYPLPNGDVLAVEAKAPEEPIGRPKDIIVGFIQGFGHSKVKAESRIILLRDADGDGKAEMRSVLIDHLNAPFGVALVGGDLYVANTDAILRYPYQTGQTQITAKPTLLTELPGGPIDHHWTKSLVASPDGSKLYVGIGSNSNITENGIEAEKDRARIWEVDRMTGAHRPFATGLRNPNGLSFEPTSGALWTVVNERDELGPDLVPDYMTSVKDGAFYGWPYSYYGQHVDPRVRPQRPDLVARAIAPDYALSSHVAPLGMAFTNNASAMPPQMRGGAFVGEHGSWNRGHLNGYKVVYIPFANGRPSGKPTDVVTGFIKDGKAQGRPVGVAIDGRGALLIADDAGNVVWRVTSSDRGCACGSVRFVTHGEPKRVGLCHCMTCRKAHSAAFNPFVVYDWAQVELSGARQSWMSSANYERAFCPSCGSRVYGAYLNGDELELSLGSFDEPNLFVPQYESWVVRREAWSAALPVTQNRLDPDEPATTS